VCVCVCVRACARARVRVTSRVTTRDIKRGVSMLQDTFPLRYRSIALSSAFPSLCLVTVASARPESTRSKELPTYINASACTPDAESFSGNRIDRIVLLNQPMWISGLYKLMGISTWSNKGNSFKSHFQVPRPQP
jgi:hypothetical protein